MSDSPNTPPADENGRPIFAETRASALIPRTPTSGSDTLVPMPEAPASGDSQTSDEIVVAPAATPATISVSPITPALLDELAATPATATQALVAPEQTPVAPVEIESTQPQVTFETAPQTPVPTTDDSALALTFAPAPDAPFQSSVTVGIRSHADGDIEGARVFYTLDGTAPDENSTPYSPEKILLTQSATLSARAFMNGKSGAICSADYIVSKPLWQENEPAQQSDPTPHKTSDNLSAPDGWQTSGASVRGKLHAHRALWREDAFALGNAQNSAGSWSICIVSDGAGSAPLSRIGSNIACQTALGDLVGSLGEIETLSDDINADLPRIKAALVGAGKAALSATRDEADKRNQPVNAFAATLLILVRRALGEAQLCAALQVGDGAIALDCASGLKLLGAADHGQHSSETRFLTTQGMEDDFANRVKFSLPKDLRATLVVSDGVSDDYFPEDQRLTEVFEATLPLAQNAEDAGNALLEWLGYEKKGSSDDRTLVLSWPARSSAVDALEAELTQSATPVSESEVPVLESETPVLETATPVSESEVADSETATSLPESETFLPEPETSLSETAIPVLESPTSLPESAIPVSESEVPLSETATPVSTAALSEVAPDVAAANSLETRDGI